MFSIAPQSPLQPHAGRVPARALTSSVKRSVLAMSMRFSYDARICVAVGTRRSINHKRTVGCPIANANSVQELQLTRHTPHHA